MSARSELGISPVLLQAIAQTLTSSALTASSRDTVPTSVARDNSINTSHLLESQQLRGKSKAEIMSLNRTSSSGVISHLLQNLNEPVASLITQTGVSSHAAHQLMSDENSSIISQAGLSVLRLSGNNAATFSGLSSVNNASMKNLSQSSMVISGEEITNFLLKDEPSDDLEPSMQRQGSQNLNAVSSVLTALASQHMQESLTRKNNKQIQNVSASQSQQQNINCSMDMVNSNNSGGGVGEARSQPQIIIYSYVNSSGQEVVLPPSSPQGNDYVVSESEGCSDSQTTYKVLLQPQIDDGEDSKSLTFQPNISYTFSSTSNVVPVTDSQNIADGMSRPCPVCGDKVSGYHYGIFTCESCKGFFKRTVQNKKTFVCPKASDCTINPLNRKKCPACRFKRCLLMGMKLEAIRQDRTRGGRSSYDGCIAHLKNRMSTLEKKIKRINSGLPLSGEVAEHCMKDGSKSHRNLVAILNHDTHKQTTLNSGAPQIPELLRDIMNLEPLLSDDDLPAESLMEAPFHEQALYSYMMQLAELRLYKLVRWARNLPQFGAISTDDQILLLQNCWSEVIALSLCWRSIDTPNQISISSTHHITAEWAQHLGFEDVVVRLLSIAEKFRKLYMDQFEYVALKVLLLITPDVKGLKEPRKINDFQDKFTEALLAYTTSHYPHMKDKFGQLLLRLPELSRISFMTKDILIKSLPPSLPCGLLVELLKGDNKGEADGSNLNL